MKREIYYINDKNGEATSSHAEAMEWYREGAEIAIMDYSETLEQWVERLRWVH